LSLFQLSWLNLNAGYWDFFWPQFIQGAGLALVFVPLTTVTMDPIGNEQMGMQLASSTSCGTSVEAWESPPEPLWSLGANRATSTALASMRICSTHTCRR